MENKNHKDNFEDFGGTNYTLIQNNLYEDHFYYGTDWNAALGAFMEGFWKGIRIVIKWTLLTILFVTVFSLVMMVF